MKRKRLLRIGISLSILVLVAAACCTAVCLHARSVSGSPASGTGSAAVRQAARSSADSRQLDCGTVLLAIGGSMLGIAMWFDRRQGRAQEDTKDTVPSKADEKTEQSA